MVSCLGKPNTMTFDERGAEQRSCSSGRIQLETKAIVKQNKNKNKVFKLNKDLT